LPWQFLLLQRKHSCLRDAIKSNEHSQSSV
jgi:hypothetical protein